MFHPPSKGVRREEWNIDKLHQGGEYELGVALPQLGIDASHGE
jgi:hypothetical protein